MFNRHSHAVYRSYDGMLNRHSYAVYTSYGDMFNRQSHALYRSLVCTEDMSRFKP